MTRFKELRRIEAAISHRNESELDWAESYCKSRLSIAPMKEHQKHWQKLLRQIDAARNPERPLLAVSRLSESSKFDDLNDRYR